MTQVPPHVVANFRELFETDIVRYLRHNPEFHTTANSYQQIIHYLVLFMVA